MNLAAAVDGFARVQSAATALVVEGREYSYAELAGAARNVAAWLRARASSTDGAPRVGILTVRSLPTYAGILGTAWIGGTYVPLNPKHPPARLASILRRARLAALIVDERGAVHLQDGEVRSAAPKKILVPDELGAAWTATERSAREAPPSPVPVSGEHPAYIMFTSGTTGVPKGVVVTAASVAYFLGHMRKLYGIHSGDRVGQFCETSFDVSVFEMFAAWDGGASLHVVPESKLMAPAGFIRQQALTVWTSVPSVISISSKMKLLDPGMFPALRVSFFIGEALPVTSAVAWRAAAPNSVIDNQYGPTEATVAFTVQRLTEPVVETPGRGTLAIGRPYPGLEVDVLGADGSFLPAGETGELALHGPQLAAGYLDDPEETARRFPVFDHPRLGRGRWYLTGDLAFQDEQGIFHCLGRADNQVKIMGHRVELEDIEAHLRAVSRTDTVAAVAWPVVDGKPAGIVAFVCGGKLAAPEIRERLRDRVPTYMLPHRVLARDSLPLSPNGKIDRKALQAMLDEQP